MKKLNHKYKIVDIMKKIILLICMVFTLSFSSCIVSEYATTQDDIYVESHSDIVRSNVDINIVLTRGIPYYYEGSILYYIYNGLYYYPFYYDNYWYMRVYSKPFNHLHYKPYFRPNKYDYRFNRNFHHPNNWRLNHIHHNQNKYRQNPIIRPKSITNNHRQRITHQQENRNGRFGGARPNTQQTRPVIPQSRPNNTVPRRTGFGNRK